MPFYSPLRYPGGKRRLVPAVARLLEFNRLRDVHYAEPFAGGAAIALALLLEGHASFISINDLSKPVFAFWHYVLNQTEDLCRRIQSTRVTMCEWRRQRAVYEGQETADLLDIGFATLFLNRTNRSGILTGGVIGGKKQSGEWTLAARFNKRELIERIRRIGSYRSRISLHNLDALTFTKTVIRKMGRNSFVFYDPPYISRGDSLYLNNYEIRDHSRLATRVMTLKQPWVVTYDNAAVEHGLYSLSTRITYGLNYSAQARCYAREVMFISDRIQLPLEWNGDFLISETAGRYPMYGSTSKSDRTCSGEDEKTRNLR